MTKEEAQIKLMEIFEELDEEHRKIEKKARAEGKWRSGLDGNVGLFKEADEKARQKAILLYNMINE